MGTNRGGAGTKKAWSHLHTWQLRIRRDVSGTEVHSEKCEIPASHRALQPGRPVSGREVPTTVGCENQWGFCLGETLLLESQVFLIKGLSTDLLTHKH